MSLDLQIASSATNLPTQSDFEMWVDSVLLELGKDRDTELTIRLAENDEIQQLNRDYRGKDKTTNVLSFPFEPYDALIAYAGDAADLNILGDIIIAPRIIEEESIAQNKMLIEHYAHMTVHGVLHLAGYDHIEDDDAVEMENKEVRILGELGIENPYRDEI